MDVDAEMAAILQRSRFAEEFLIRAGGGNAAAPQGCCRKGVKVGSRQLHSWLQGWGHGCPVPSELPWGSRGAVARRRESFWARQEPMGH